MFSSATSFHSFIQQTFRERFPWARHPAGSNLGHSIDLKELTDTAASHTRLLVEATPVPLFSPPRPLVYKAMFPFQAEEPGVNLLVPKLGSS